MNPPIRMPYNFGHKHTEIPEWTALEAAEAAVKECQDMLDMAQALRSVAQVQWQQAARKVK
jgi:hypothetical protein